MEPDGSSISFPIAALLLLVIVNAFFAMSEIAIISLNDNKVRKMAQEGNRTAKLLQALIDKPSQFLATIQVGITMSGFLASAVAADTFVYRLSLAFPKTLSAMLVRVAALVIITLLLSFFHLVLGELVPKRIAMQHSEKIAFAVARPLTVLSYLERPFVVLLSAFTNGILRLVGIDPSHKQETVTEEEIRMLIDVGNESGNIEKSDKEMINNIFEFDDRDVMDVMTHRTEMKAVSLSAPLDDIITLAVDTGYSRIPVYEETVDSIVGILYVKDLLELIRKKQAQSDFHASQYMREALYVPESTRCKPLLEEFQQKKLQMAVVVDEYGGTSGIITMEDLLESIVGNIQDEYDDEEEDISPLSENQYQVDGLTPMDEVAKFFDLTIPDEDDFDTIGGYVVNRLGRIPEEEEHASVTIEDVCFTAWKVDDRRITQLLAQRMESSSAEGEPALEA